MLYNYECIDCYVTITGDVTGDGHVQITNEQYEEHVLFETSHSIKPTADELYQATECPRCGGHNCHKTFYGSNIIGYIKGNGYLDKAGVQRDMHLYKLTENDPYGEYRVPGEVDHIKSQLKRGGQHKIKKIYNTSISEMSKAVEKSVNSTDK